MNDIAKLLNDIRTVTGIVSPDIDETTLTHRLEELLGNYKVKKKVQEDIENDVDEHAQIFLSAKKIEGLSELTLESYVIELKMFNEYLQKAVSTITSVDIRRYLASNEEWKPGTIEKKLSVLKSFFDWLQQEELILKNPAKRVKTPKKPNRLPKFLSIEEVELIREHCTTSREKVLIEIMLSTGCRLSEIASITIDKIDFSERSIRVIGKGDKERIVYFSPRAEYHLKSYLEDRKEIKETSQNYLLLGERRPYRKMGNRAIQRAVAKIGERANLSDPLTPHRFRHTAGTMMMNNGADLVDVQHMLGHANPATSLIYSQVSESRKKQAHQRYLTY